MWHKWQYISQGSTPQWHVRHIQMALDSGTQWIQLRLKGEDEKTVCKTGLQVERLCRLYKARFILNDFPALVQSVGADGVHLGLLDGSVQEARQLLGADKIIGGTANSYEDVVLRTHQGCDYIGLGPLRFTTTKEKLSPLLGIDAYRQILLRYIRACQAQHLQAVPIYAIGGIVLEDIASLIRAGVHGVALSGLLTTTEDESGFTELTEENMTAAAIIIAAGQQLSKLKAITNQINNIIDDKS